MKLWKKTIAILTLALAMCFTAQVDVNARQANTTETLIWDTSYNIELASKGEEEYYEYNMTLQQSGRVNFTVSAENESWAYLNVYDMSEKIWYTDLSAGLNTYSLNLLAGDYRVEVSTSKHWGELNASLIPTFVASGETVSEAYMNKNNQLGTASGYSIGQLVKAQFAVNDDTDIYKVKINKTGYLNMKFYSEINSLDMSISCLDKDITYKEYDIPLGTSSYKYFVPKGTYYISFTRDGYTGTYTFSSKISNMPKSRVSSVKNLKGKQAKVSWAKKADVDGYQIQVATNKKFTKNKKTGTVSGNYANNYTFFKMKKGKTYYARVRTYKVVGGKRYYSDWSSTKKVKITK